MNLRVFDVVPPAGFATDEYPLLCRNNGAAETRAAAMGPVGSCAVVL